MTRIRWHQNQRKVICCAIALNLLIWPAPRITLNLLASPIKVVAASINSEVNDLRAIPLIDLPVGPVIIPVPMLPIWPFQSSTPVSRDLTMAERTARVVTARISPHKLVGYIGDSITFVAMGTDVDGKPAQGANFSWESSDQSKLSIDEAGQASLLAPGFVTVTARAGLTA
ncbi:MAG TPA: hypothetical protein VKN18_22830, partial [Blastocatellia bacterium]|nr:hypothetical protein [Blastocatellia bacterium]